MQHQTYYVVLMDVGAAVIICAASLVIGWRYGVIKTRAELLAEGGKSGKTGARNRTVCHLMECQ